MTTGVLTTAIDAPRSEERSPAAELAERLLAHEERVSSLLAWLLESHYRGEKAWWREYFDRIKATED